MWLFTPHFPEFRTFRTLQPFKRYVILGFLVENKAFDLSKKALRAVTARNEWLKKSPDGPGNKKHMSEASSKNAEILFRSSRS